MSLSFMSMLCVMQAAFAQTGSDDIVIRLKPGTQVVSATPTVTLTPPEGEAVTVELNDDGISPDLTAGDGWLAGLAQMESSTVVITVDVGRELDGGTVSWDANAKSRDLMLSLTWAGVTVIASDLGKGAAESYSGPAPGNMQAPSGSALAPSGSVQAPSGTAPAVASNGLLMWASMGIGLLCILAGFGLAVRNARPPLQPMSLARVPEPPFLGPGTPALHWGLSVWTVSESDRSHVGRAMLCTIARRHRVLLRLPEGAKLPTVLGGPVYVTTTSECSELEEHLLDMLERPGLPVVVLYVGKSVSASMGAALADILDPDVGGILLATDLQGGQAVDATMEVTASGVDLRTKMGTVSLVERSDEGYFRLPGFSS